MYLSCLNHVNKLPNVSTASRPIFMRFYIQKYVSVINLQFLSCLHQLNELEMIPNWQFLCLGKMFLYLIHFLHLFYIKLFSQSEIIFTNNEHAILRRLLFIFALFDLFKSMLIKSRVYEFKSQIPRSSSPYIQSRPNRVCEFYLVNILTFSK